MITSRWEQIKSIFGAAVELPEEERPAFVARACGEDFEVHAEVLTLLAAHRSMGSFMNDPITVEPPPSLNSHNRYRLPLGEILCERFEIGRLLGEGGMGRVYEALDLDLGVRLALKTIRPEIAADPRTIDLFKHEIQLARQVTHPNVCRIFDLERHKGADHQITFLTMELLEGETLENLLQREGALDVGDAFPLIEQMVEGLMAIHDVAVIHRDFKPSNVLLVQTGTKTRVVITDFGLARAKALAAVNESAGGLRLMTGLAGTPAYMAPEQLAGGEISPATDVYALGLVVYKMVTGRLPHERNERGPMPRSSVSAPCPSPRLYAPGLDACWEEGILRCLEIDPASRYHKASQLLDVLSERTRSPNSFTRRTDRLLEPAHASPLNSGVALSRSWKSWIWATLVLLALGLGAADLVLRRQHTDSGTVELTPVTSDSGLTWGPSLSADGKLLAYSSDRHGPGNLNIWVKNLVDGSEVQVTQDAADATTPALSPDGKLVAYRSERNGGGIYLSSSKGGTATLLAPLGRNPRFSPDGTRIAYWVGEEHDLDEPFNAGGRAFLIPVAGGIPTQIKPEFADARYPTWSDDGRSIMFQGASERKATFDEASDWWIESEDTHKAVATGGFAILRQEGLVLYGCRFEWSKDHLIFAARKSFGTSLWALLVASDSRVQLPLRRITSGFDDDIEPWTSSQEKLVLAGTNASIPIWKIPLRGTQEVRSGDLERVTSSSAVDDLLSASSDGNSLVFHRRTGQLEQTLLKDAPTGRETILPIPPDALPVVTGDGRKVVYSILRDGKHPIYEMELPAGASIPLCDDCGPLMDISRDEGRILYGLENGGIGVMDLASKRKSEAVRGDNTILEQARFSADGRWMVFVSTVDEQHSQLRLAPVSKDASLRLPPWYPLTSGSTRDLRPAWSPSGSTVFFLSNRDGFSCVWRLELNPATGHPLGEQTLVTHLHSAHLSPMHLSRSAMGLSLGGNSLFLTLGEVTGNIFSADLR